MSNTENGPEYPRDLGATVAKFRNKARDGLRALSPDERHAYGTAVAQAILAKQRSEARAGLPPTTPKARCASGTYHSDGGDIHEAIRSKHRAALAAYPAKVRRRRTPREWQKLYAQAMKQKQAALDKAA